MRIPASLIYTFPLLLLPFLTLLHTDKPSPMLPPPDYAASWKSADSLMARGLPQSALVIADRIYAEAKQAGNDPQLLKAAMRRVVYRTNGAKDEETYLTMIGSLKADINTTKGPTRAVLQSVLAEVYWQYFQQNRYKFINRTATAPDDPTSQSATSDIDPRTWDARRLQTTVTELYTASVQDAARLQQSPVATYDAVINRGNEEGRALRPTLFDVLAHRAIDFFDDVQTDVIKPVQAFTVNNPAYLAGPETFVATVLPATDPLSGPYQALKLYQQLLAFHRNDANPIAFAVNDVERLALVKRLGTLPNEEALYRQTVTQQIATFKNKAAEAEYMLALVQDLASEGQVRPLPRGRYGSTDQDTSEPDVDTTHRWDRKRAAELARDLIARFPNSIPAQTARPLLDNLVRPVLGVEVEGANVPGKPFRARVTFQNTKTLFYKILRLTADEARALTIFNDYQTDPKRDKWFAAVQNHPVVGEAQLALPDDGDLRRHSVEIPVKALPLGYYVLLVSNEGKWAKPSAETAEVVSIGTFAVSNLSYVLVDGNYQYDNDVKTIYVTDRTTGQPIANATVQLLTLNDQGKKASVSGSVQTNAQGKLVLNASQMPGRESYFLRLIRNDDVLDTDIFYSYRYGRSNVVEPESQRAAIFTDRAIYRPGQTVYWKVLVYSGKDNQFVVVPNKSATVRLMDVNGEEVAKAEVKTNEFGSASGTFTAPVGRLTGQMTLMTDYGQASIRVEEYKRPTFTVVADPLKQAVVLGQNVPVKATAKTLAGAVVDNAKVSYRVTRTYYQPYWGWNWWRPARPSNEQEIANGTTTTNADGVVDFAFLAQPDLSSPASDKPQFTFTVTIDVTDQSGETRSATQTLRIGYTALTAELALPSPVLTTEQKPYVVRLTNASGNEVGIKSGTVAIARLTPSRMGLRSRLWPRADRTVMTRDEYVAQFPLDLYANEDDPATWARTPIRSASPKSISLAGLPSGMYAADINATDSAGQTAQQTVFFQVIDPQQPTAPIRSGTFVQVQKATAQPSEEAVFWVGTSTASTEHPNKILMAVEEKGKVVREEWLTVTGQPLRVVLPVQEKHRGNFAVHFAMVQNGRLLSQSETVTVPFTNKELTIETETFRDKLKPGQPEQWTLRISGPKQDKVLAELAATLYDASLDAFARLEWPTSFYGINGTSSSYWQSPAFGTKTTQQYWNAPSPPYPSSIRKVPELGWGPYRYDSYRGRFFNQQPTYLGSVAIHIERAGNVVTGRVSLADGDVGLPAVSVVVKGTKVETGTDDTGAFRLTIPATTKKPTLVFSVIGFKRVEVALGTKKVVDATMAEDISALNEVVVVGYGNEAKRSMTGAVATMAAPASMAKMAIRGTKAEEAMADAAPEQAGNPNVPAKAPVADPPVIRKNFNETAFFFPQLQTDKQGRVVLNFTMPEALTRWRLVTFAHTKTMQTGTLEREIVTQKELMVTTNVPRFLRENDTLRLTARIDNLSGKPLTGTATLQLTDALTGELLNGKMLSKTSTNSLSRSFTIEKTSTVIAWTLVVPQDLPPVAIRVTATAGTFTDGEERVVPVLPNRTLVTDVQPFWINGGDNDRTFRLEPLAGHNPELPLNTERLTVEVTSNPAWYALQSLPYLMEYNYDCAEQLFSKMYANSLGAHILNSRPQFRQVVDLWKQSPPRSPLASNEELKAVTLENTPWLNDAKSETERTARLGQFFDQNRLASEQRTAIGKLRQLQDGSGALTWFSGMRPSLNMTLHVLAGLGHLRKLGVTFDPSAQAEAATLQAGLLRYADAEATRQIAEEKARAAAQKRAPGTPYWAAQYLYARSFFLDSNPVEKAIQTYLLPVLTSGWQQSPLQSQALAATTLYRFKQIDAARAILQSLTERSKVSDELGMYWPENAGGTYWYQAPVETHAYIIEAYDEACRDEPGKAAKPMLDCFAWLRTMPQYSKLVGNEPFIDKMRQWLVQQKRTQAWPSTKATTEAIYALLLRGSDWLDTKATMKVVVGGKDIASRVTKTEALTGYQKVTFTPAEVTASMGVVTVSKPAKTGPGWGATYWQHFEPLDAVAGNGNNLTLKKTLYRQRNTDAGPVLDAITPKTVLKPGDLLKVRVVLTADRSMEYVHLKDGRASGFEPVAALSGTKYQNGLYYYEAPRDASTDFFIEYLPTGTHVFEYALRVVHTGDFGSGVATVQCFYAPEFAAHSSGGRVQVR
ncbi:alpha-2-macroglobulin family protein [Fibrella forsythiae]|uniref:Carboxypeptidase-like regulatory domain-containing protein n=1 Tax=Fibrella forsythiae TaxID=2817061 RepID=A0ABS3JMA5_9BACT|nr:alpha-2-macroglobulin family protein [Fibrella forsythiae]MBO0950536.1 carboxypeptidase-like regulatory domain-containing protein [Fibrella forsythiae]